MINDAYMRHGPNQTNEQRLTGIALAAVAGMSHDDILAIRPPIPRMGLFPPKYGYRVDAYGIADIVHLDEIFPGSRVDYSQSSSGYQGTSFPSLHG